MAATLANGGKNPVTGKQVVKSENVPEVLAVMATAGLYDDSGKWLFTTGLPAKSGVGGGLIAVSPGKFGIAVIAPPLDKAGNSVRGAEGDRRRLERARRQPVRAEAPLRNPARSGGPGPIRHDQYQPPEPGGGAGKGATTMAKKKKPVDEAKAAGDGKLGRKEYDKELERLHVELVKLQRWVVAKGLKVCVVFEGRDGAGKGGTIKAITERVSPRVFRVVALPAPTEREKTQMYIQRYMAHFPAAGEVVIFDRSWYNRAGVERVMGFTPMDKVKKFLGAVPFVEKAMVEAGIILVKYWLEVTPEEQTRRLKGRIEDGRKIWKLTSMDLKSYCRWYDYSRARDDMFAATDTDFAPWLVAPLRRQEEGAAQHHHRLPLAGSRTRRSRRRR